MRVLVTGSCGLIGSEAVLFYANQGHQVFGIDNNLRRQFFGPQGDTDPVREYLERELGEQYRHHAFDIRDRNAIFSLYRKFHPHLIIHCAAQPSDELATKNPHEDFEINAVGTLNLLEALREVCPRSVFVFLSSNKVYGDAPNRLPLVRLPLRFEYDNELKGKGVDETLGVDGCTHSLFGVSKLSADVLCQEYGRFFGLKIGVFRGSCFTGLRHGAVQDHGFLPYLVECALQRKTYTIMGHSGRQVRDQIHASDVVFAIELFRRCPRFGEVYNIGGGYENSISIRELVIRLQEKFGLTLQISYSESRRRGDHICYYTNMQKFKDHYPDYEVQVRLDAAIEEIIQNSGKVKEQKSTSQVLQSVEQNS